MKVVEIDTGKLTLMRVAKFRKAMTIANATEDPVEQLIAQSEVLAGLTDNWTPEAIQDLPVFEFNQFKEAIETAIAGIIPNTKRPA